MSNSLYVYYINYQNKVEVMTNPNVNVRIHWKEFLGIGNGITTKFLLKEFFKIIR